LLGTSWESSDKTAKLCSFYQFCAWFMFIKGDILLGVMLWKALMENINKYYRFD